MNKPGNQPFLTLYEWAFGKNKQHFCTEMLTTSRFSVIFKCTLLLNYLHDCLAFFTCYSTTQELSEKYNHNTWILDHHPISIAQSDQGFRIYFLKKITENSHFHLNVFVLDQNRCHFWTPRPKKHGGMKFHEIISRITDFINFFL